MIEHLHHMAIFEKVIGEGSFRAAATSVGHAPSGMSETVSELKASLGVTLLYRTIRNLALTNEQRMFCALYRIIAQCRNRSE